MTASINIDVPISVASPIPIPPVRSPLGVIDALLRDRDSVLDRITTGQDLARIMRVMVATIAVAMAVVGASIGTYRGDIQILYAAIKLPLVLLGTAALSAPVLTAIGAAIGRKSYLASDLTLVTTALAFGALLLAACTPVILFGRAIDLSYHRMAILVVGLFAIAGVASLRIVLRALSIERASGWRTSIAGLAVVFTLVGGQLSWALRPYLVRPRAPEVTFLRPLEGSLYDAITQSVESARGVYTREAAP